MFGLGTIINAAAIVAGGLLGLLFGKLLKERHQETILKGMGFVVIVMAIGSVVAKMLVVDITQKNGTFVTNLDTQGTLMMIISVAIGALLGEIINIEYGVERFGTWLKMKSGSEKDHMFVDAFMTASLTVVVGAMGVMGSIQDGISGDHTILIAKAVIDLVVIMMMTASMGKGCIFSAIPVFAWEGFVTLIATFIAPVLTQGALDNIALVGNVLILCVGINMVWPKTIRVANLLPAIFIAAAYAFI